jgi:hypothetical protein
MDRLPPAIYSSDMGQALNDNDGEGALIHTPIVRRRSLIRRILLKGLGG